jgi:hypothetical protein
MNNDLKKQNLTAEARRHGENQRKRKSSAADCADERRSGKAKIGTTEDTKEHRGKPNSPFRH